MKLEIKNLNSKNGRKNEMREKQKVPINLKKKSQERKQKHDKSRKNQNI